MGKIKKPVPVKLIVGMLSAEEALFEKVEEKLSQKFGPVDFGSPVLSFRYTDYYEKEMGKGLRRKFISFQRLIDPGYIAKIKLFTNELEGDFLHPHSSNRRINLDPGYICLSKLVLVTTKNQQHRLYLEDSIYGEVTLRYKRGRGFKPWQWTYPDYKSKEYLEIFNHIREIYRGQIKKWENRVKCEGS